MTELTRRTVMALGSLAAIAPATAWSARDADSLHAIAARRGLRFGSAISAGAGGGVRNPRYAALVAAQCGIVVPENELKWQATRPSADSFNFAPFDTIIDFAADHGLAVRGHTLLWHRTKWMPGWEETHDYGSQPAREADRLLTTHIETVCRRYAGRIKAFDVVNETVMEDGSLAQTALSKAIGGTEILVDLAFHTARAAAPEAELVYNDYMGWEPGNEAHRAGVLRLLEGFRKRGTPVDALGLQSHLIVNGGRPQEHAWRDFLDAVTAMGYRLVITEHDARGNALSADIAKRDAETAAIVKAYLDLTLSYRQLRDVLVWGMVDRFSWLQGFEPRTDGLPTRGCPYDDDYRPKPMRAAIAAALAAAPTR